MARVIVVLFAAGVLSAMLPVAADPARSAVEAVLSEFDAEETSDSGKAGVGPLVVVPDTATPAALPPTTSPPEATTPREVETVVAEAPPTTTPPTTTTTTTSPAQVSPAAVGTYRYRAEITDEDGTRQHEWDMDVDAPRDVDGETRQAFRRNGDSGPEQEEHRAWRTGGVYLDRLRVSGDDFDCEPPVLLYPYPLEVGREWEHDSSCSYERTEEHEYGQGTYSFTFAQQASLAITGVDRVTVDGEEIAVYVIETTLDEDDENRRWMEETTEWFAPASGLMVRFESHRQVFEDGEAVHESSERSELVSLAPR